MPTQPYRNKKGQRLPSVTTCLSVLAKPAIIHWAWQLGVEGLDYRKVKESASSTGTLVHELMLHDLKNEEPDLSNWTGEQIQSTIPSMTKYSEWKTQHKIEVINLETALVSEKYGYGGTFDFLGRIDGQLVLADFKTSKSLYIENCCQLAAYRELVRECGGVSDGIGISLRVLRVGKENGGELKEYILPEEDTESYWKMFLATKMIYEISKSTKLPK